MSDQKVVQKINIQQNPPIKKHEFKPPKWMRQGMEADETYLNQLLFGQCELKENKSKQPEKTCRLSRKQVQDVFWGACRVGRSKLVQRMLSNSLFHYLKFPEIRHMALIKACQSGSVETIRVVYEPHMANEAFSAATFACAYGHRAVVDFFLSQGIEVSPDCVFCAREGNHHDLAEYLISKCKNVSKIKIHGL